MSCEFIIRTTALLFFKFLAIFLSNLIEKLGLAASCIKTFFGLYLFRNSKALKEESDLSFPPLMIRRPPRSTQSRSSAASDVYKRQT